MATLSAPTNTPTTDGAVIGCTTDDTTGTAYAMARIDRQWYSVANGDSQALADADKATILAQDITASELVWAGTDEDLSTIQLTIDGLAARLDPANPYYVGWVQPPVSEIVGLMTFHTDADGATFTRTGTATGPKSDGGVIQQAENASVHQFADWNGSVYSNTSGLSEGILLEDTRTNINEESVNYSLPTWFPTGCTVLANQPGKYAQQDSAAEITITAATSYFLRNEVVTPGTVMTFSQWVKRGTITGAVFSRLRDNTNGAWISDPIDMELTSEWKQYSQTLTIPAGCISLRVYTFSAADSAAGTFFADMPQLEDGTFPSSYIPTPTANPQARQKTNMSRTFADIGMPGLVNNFKITAEFTLPYASTECDSQVRTAFAAVGDSSNRFAVFTHVNGQISLNCYDSGVSTTVHDVFAWDRGQTFVVECSRSAAEGLEFIVNGRTLVYNAARKGDLATALDTLWLGEKEGSQHAFLAMASIQIEQI